MLTLISKLETYNKAYTIKKAFPTTKKVKLIGKKLFAIAALDLDYTAFIVYIAGFYISFDTSNEVHPLKKTQIAYLKVDKTPTEVFSEYTDLIDIFSPKLVAKLLKYMGINNYTL